MEVRMIGPNEIRDLKNAVEKKYKDLFENLEADRKKDIEAIDRVYDLQKSFVSRPVEERPQKKTSSLGAATVIREAIRGIKNDFDLNTITDYLKSVKPSVEVTRGNFHAAIKKMVEDGEAIVVEQGRGKIATTYRYTKNKEVGIPELPQGEIIKPQEEKNKMFELHN
jgi:hypothetical protein